MLIQLLNMIHFKLIDWMQCFRTSVSGSWNEFLLQFCGCNPSAIRPQMTFNKKSDIADSPLLSCSWIDSFDKMVEGENMNEGVPAGLGRRLQVLISLPSQFVLLPISLRTMILTSIIQIEFLFYPARDLMQKMGQILRLSINATMRCHIKKYSNSSNMNLAFEQKPYLTEQASDSSVTQGGENPATFSRQPWRNRIEEWKKRLSV
ncbi:LOW QUALITY PROTEIN: hypothetical protein NC651_011158 [Populus alba x Populus x berolinensis]|nr:LOW QUALITY PROTEIN: hypothetical protein NC651_011158 [Populus alba x Populus x berolinensis]